MRINTILYEIQSLTLALTIISNDYLHLHQAKELIPSSSNISYWRLRTNFKKCRVTLLRKHTNKMRVNRALI